MNGLGNVGGQLTGALGNFFGSSKKFDTRRWKVKNSQEKKEKIGGKMYPFLANMPIE